MRIPRVYKTLFLLSAVTLAPINARAGTLCDTGLLFLWEVPAASSYSQCISYPNQLSLAQAVISAGTFTRTYSWCGFIMPNTTTLAYRDLNYWTLARLQQEMLAAQDNQEKLCSKGNTAACKKKNTFRSAAGLLKLRIVSFSPIAATYQKLEILHNSRSYCREMPR